MFADDAMIIAEDETELRKKLNVFKYECGKMGLELNEKKSQIMYQNGKDGGMLKEIGGIPIVDRMKYLGIVITNEAKNITKKHTKEKINKGKKFNYWIRYMLR